MAQMAVCPCGEEFDLSVESSVGDSVSEVAKPPRPFSACGEPPACDSARQEVCRVRCKMLGDDSKRGQR